MADPSTALLLVNRRATGADSNLEDGIELLKAAGMHVVVEAFEDPSAVPARIRAERQAAIVIIAGGDGTLNACVEELLASGRPLGILPMGNANDLARTLDIPFSLDAACSVIARGRRRWIDLGRVNGKHFFNVASIGLSVEIANEMNPELKRRWRLLSYAIAAWKAVKRLRSFKVRVKMGDRTETLRTLQIAVGNGRYYGGGMAFADDASIDDGRLILYSVNPLPWWKLALLFPAIRWGKHHTVDDVRLLHGTEFTIKTRRPMPINLDGEVLARTPAKFEVVPRALEVFAPDTSEGVERKAAANDALP